MYFLNKVDIYSKHFISTEVKPFFTGKMVEMNDEDSAQKVQKKCIKVHKKVHKKLFYCTGISVSDIVGFFLFHFFAIWLSVKYQDFTIIKTLFLILHAFVLLYKEKLKLQHKNAKSLLCINMLHFHVALFPGRSFQSRICMIYR